MGKRIKVKKSVDRKIFKRTATQIKKENLYPQNMRGGIRM